MAALKTDDMKYYFEDSDSEMCHQECYFQDMMCFDGKSEMELFEAIPDKTGGGIFWCKLLAFCGDDTGDSCGKQCEDYEPRNGKSGCCKHHTSWLYIHGNKIILTAKQKTK